MTHDAYFGDLYDAGADPARSPRRPAGATVGANSSYWPILANRRSLSKRSAGSTRSSRSSVRSTALWPSSGSRSARIGSGRLSASSKDRCSPNAPGCRGTPISPRRWITCSSAGRPSPAFSTTAASARRTMPLSAVARHRSRASRVAIRRLRSRRERAAAMYALIATAKLNGVDPLAWLADGAAPHRRSSGFPARRAAALALEAARNPRRCRLTVSHHGLGRMVTIGTSWAAFNVAVCVFERAGQGCDRQARNRLRLSRWPACDSLQGRGAG
jgi:hypothetical protein